MTPRVLLVVGTLVVGLAFTAGIAAAARGEDRHDAPSGSAADPDEGEKAIRKAERHAQHEAAREAQRQARDVAKEERKAAREDRGSATPGAPGEGTPATGVGAPAPATPPAAPPASETLASTVAGQTAPIAISSPVAPRPGAATIAGAPHRLPATSFWPLPQRAGALAALPTADSPDTAALEHATTFGIGGAAAPSARGWDPIPRAAVDEGAGTPWWMSLLWGLPILGVSGAGAVVLAKRRRREVELVPVTVVMKPVAPRDLHGLLRNGQGAVAKGALSEAIAWFDQALRLQPRLAVALFCKGVCLAALGRTSEAFGTLQAATRAAPEETSYRVHLAHVALALGKHKDAMDALAAVTLAMPELGPAMLEDPKLAALRDHPRFLAICGAL